MNFLAHMYLSFGDEELLMGNFIADFIRNRDLVLYSDQVVRGVELHRHIDHFTDTHPIVIESTKVFHRNHGKYAPVVIDVCYDYILSQNWDKYAEEGLRSFSDQVYSVLDRHKAILSDRLCEMSKKMIADDFLLKYGTEDGIRRTFDRIRKRAKFEGNWSRAYDDLIANYGTIESGFDNFFPDIIASVKSFIDNR